MPAESSIMPSAEFTESDHNLVRPGEDLSAAADRIRIEVGIDDVTWQMAVGFLEKLKDHDEDVYEHSYRSFIYMSGVTLFREHYDDPASASLAAFLHDIGKYGIHTDTINYPGIYDREELQDDMRRHPWFGFQALKNAGFPPEVTLPVAWHHRFPPEGEKHGYGPSLDTEEIVELNLDPWQIDRGIITGKLVMLVDNFDSAMTRNDLIGSKNPPTPEARHQRLLARFPDDAARLDWLFERRIEVS